MNFNKEFGYPLWSDFNVEKIVFKYHRYKYPERASSMCSFKLTLWDLSPTIFSTICKKCLSTFSEEEIEDLKQYLINKKLGVKV